MRHEFEKPGAQEFDPPVISGRFTSARADADTVVTRIVKIMPP